ncbi:hypothetical protein HK099_003692 [Clydaea vesicula]|uniref:Clathrin adaptor alpha/beta/gamma-adaptin appendage Ig-like subdomain domain-containing protein n=1 Tax=Clydaea vesicula TaxID=447962 RepID=A0AAD5U459_9FUNG|nr:hypothetical protein HK099_003692 [Clydaea vesicula]
MSAWEGGCNSAGVLVAWAGERQVQNRMERGSDEKVWMRGLTVFIADIRNCRARELEEKRINKELANIRTKFKDEKLSGYHRTKYIAKLIYMYITGWPVDFGHSEAINLIASSKYGEKRMGYLAITLMIPENSELLQKIILSIKSDLQDSNNQETHTCLALCAIANMNGKELAEVFNQDVMRLMVNSSKNFVKKKAALCLLKLYRKYPEVIPVKEWANKILPLMDDHDFGVALCVTSLVLAIAQQHSTEYKGCVEKGNVQKISNVPLNIVKEKNCRSDYIYYKVPVPWLQVKLLRLLQYYSSDQLSENKSLLEDLNYVLLSIIRSNSSVETSKNAQQANAQNSILFEAINLAIHLEANSEIVLQAMSLLNNHITSKETNLRYLGLDTLSHYVGCVDTLDTLKSHQENIIVSLNDKDISVRRRARKIKLTFCLFNAEKIVDLLYSMCDDTNVRVIVHELLQYLTIADYAIKEELVLKIAILVEKFTTDSTWYVDVMIQLMLFAGDHVSDDIWHRVIQIITNDPDLQPYAARSILNNIQSPNCHESVLKIGGYVLGAILNLPTTDLLEKLCDVMPPFAARESALLSRLQKKIHDTEDKRTWMIGGLSANKKTISNKSTSKEANSPIRTEDEVEMKLLRFDVLICSDNGVLFEDSALQIGLKSEYHSQYGRIGLYFGNRSNANYKNVKISVDHDDAVKFNMVQPLGTTLESHKQMYNIECLNTYNSFPILKVEYDSGNNEPVKLQVNLPTAICKFFDKVVMESPDFFGRWKQLEGPPRECTLVFNYTVEEKKIEKLLEPFLFILKECDPNPVNVVGCGIFNSTILGKVGCLARVEVNQPEKVLKLSVRTTAKEVSENLAALIKQIILCTYTLVTFTAPKNLPISYLEEMFPGDRVPATLTSFEFPVVTICALEKNASITTTSCVYSLTALKKSCNAQGIIQRSMNAGIYGSSLPCISFNEYPSFINVTTKDTTMEVSISVERISEGNPDGVLVIVHPQNPILENELNPEVNFENSFVASSGTIVEVELQYEIMRIMSSVLNFFFRKVWHLPLQRPAEIEYFAKGSSINVQSGTSSSTTASSNSTVSPPTPLKLQFRYPTLEILYEKEFLPLTKNSWLGEVGGFAALLMFLHQAIMLFATFIMSRSDQTR